jgi:SWI/SNF-related matrix-associated actin-dependent regulator 1 of chromatin subfamily A
MQNQGEEIMNPDLIIARGKCSGYTTMVWSHHQASPVDFLKSIPGPTWDARINGMKGWSVPDELIEGARQRTHGKVIDVRESKEDVSSGFNPKLIDYQQGDAAEILDKRAFFLQYDTGVGKTVTAIEALRLNGTKRGLVICPASIRKQWTKELNGWWPEAKVQIVESSDEDLHLDKTMLVASYEAVYNHHKRVAKGEAKCNAINVVGLDGLVADESHYIKSGLSVRSRSIYSLSKSNSHALKLCLSATPVTNRVQDFWGQVNFLTPGRLGPFKRFALHYFDCEEQVHKDRAHLVINELKPEMVEELRTRLNWFSSYRSKDSIRQHLKGIESISCIWSWPSKSYSCVDLKSPTKEDREQHYNTTSEEKSHLVANHIRERIIDEQVLVFCYLQKTAERIVKHLQNAGRTAYLIHGGLTTNKRRKALAAALADPKGVLVVTMHSMGTGTNKLVAFARNTLFAELYWTQGVVGQSLGRVNRINNTHAARIKIFGIRQTLDEKMALMLSTKLEQELRIKDVGKDQTMLDAAILRAADSAESERELAMSVDVDPFATMFGCI